MSKMLLTCRKCLPLSSVYLIMLEGRLNETVHGGAGLAQSVEHVTQSQGGKCKPPVG